MKRYIAMISILFLIFVSSYSAQQKIEITLIATQLEYNNHVGNDWSTDASVNSKKIVSDIPILFNAEDIDEIVLRVSATELDKIPDRGSNSKTIKLSELRKDKPQTYVLTVVVRENRGRYSGNTAKWNFTFRVAYVE